MNYTNKTDIPAEISGLKIAYQLHRAASLLHIGRRQLFCRTAKVGDTFSDSLANLLWIKDGPHTIKLIDYLGSRKHDAGFNIGRVETFPVGAARDIDIQADSVEQIIEKAAVAIADRAETILMERMGASHGKV